MKDKYNHMKVVPAEKQKTNKWMAEKLGKDQTSASKWCTNKSLSSVVMLYEIAKCLDVYVKTQLWPSEFDINN